MTIFLAADWVQALILGILQGLTEFLPVSSSAHLIVLPWVFQWEPFGLSFDLALHLGTLLSLLVYFRAEVRSLIHEVLGVSRGRLSIDSGLALLLAGTVPIVLVGLLALQIGIESLRTPAVTAVNLLVFAGLMLWADRRGRGLRNIDSLATWDAFLIGCGQALAVMPGVSRSGITITVALLVGLRRPEAARFAFLLGIPAIGMATGAMIPEFLNGSETTHLAPSVLFAGILAAFLTGLLCIRSLIQFLQSRSLMLFVVYRSVLAVAILFSFLSRTLPG